MKKETVLQYAAASGAATLWLCHLGEVSQLGRVTLCAGAEKK